MDHRELLAALRLPRVAAALREDERALLSPYQSLLIPEAEERLRLAWLGGGSASAGAALSAGLAMQRQAVAARNWEQTWLPSREVEHALCDRVTLDSRCGSASCRRSGICKAEADADSCGDGDDDAFASAAEPEPSAAALRLQSAFAKVWQARLRAQEAQEMVNAAVAAAKAGGSGASARWRAQAAGGLTHFNAIVRLHSSQGRNAGSLRQHRDARAAAAPGSHLHHRNLDRDRDGARAGHRTRGPVPRHYNHR